jgi:protocatechuate 3,4-dioxygenase beta subunit
LNHDHAHDHHDHGLGADLEHLIRQAAQRRRALRWLLAGGAALGVAACGGGGGDDSSSSSSSSSGSSGSSGGSGSTTCSVIPEETNGPYPGDGSNSNASGVANALMLSGIVRGDIRSSLGSSTLQAGVPLTLKLVLVNTNASCASLEGFAVYAWHCNEGGLYSMYSSGVTGETWLRGVQATDSTGSATFTTVFPGCYLGRMPHVHFEVYRSLTTATSFSNRLKTSQVAFPTAVCDTVYATSGYASSKTNFAQISFATDNVFSDGYSTQLASVTGAASRGYVATLEVGVSV